MIISTDKTVDNKPLSYEIFEDGYAIYLEGKLWITQRGQYSKPIDKTKSFEENCLLQIEELAVVPEVPNNKYGVSNETYNAIIDDYTLELMENGAL